MDRVLCDIEQCETANGEGLMVPGVRATCSECQHQTESYGTAFRSVRRCLALLREECPMLSQNWYVADQQTDEEE